MYKKPKISRIIEKLTRLYLLFSFERLVLSQKLFFEN